MLICSYIIAIAAGLYLLKNLGDVLGFVIIAVWSLFFAALAASGLAILVCAVWLVCG